MSEAQVEMPKYKCHKEVWALKIKDIQPNMPNEENTEWDGSHIIQPEETGYAAFKVNHGYVRKHAPKAGGYYVVYQDGYTSFSPADAFEGGYELCKKKL
jgi:hypothetical protein